MYIGPLSDPTHFMSQVSRGLTRADRYITYTVYILFYVSSNWVVVLSPRSLLGIQTLRNSTSPICRCTPEWPHRGLRHIVSGSDLITKKNPSISCIKLPRSDLKTTKLFGVQKPSNSRNLHKLPVHSGMAPSWLET